MILQTVFRVFLIFIAGFLSTGTAQELPKGVPRTVLPDGNVFIEPMFTTRQFQGEARKMVIAEANRVAAELKLPEKLPITEADVVRSYVGPFGFTYATKKLGNITTRNYSYGVEQNFKFSELIVANYDQTCIKLRERGSVPVTKVNTNAAYQLASRWLNDLGMDLESLNRDCQPHVAVSPFWNGLTDLGDKPRGKSFFPIYYVWWVPKQQQIDSPAAVELFLPTKMLLQLNVGNSKYILRKPLVFTNLDALFPDTNAHVTIITNWPKTINVPAPPAN